MSRVITTLLFLLLFAVLSMALQIFLSTREARWPGLVQPILWLGLPLLFVLSVAAVGDPLSVLTTLFQSVLISVWPALIHFAIHAACRSHLRKKQARGRPSSEYDRSRIQDLE